MSTSSHFLVVVVDRQGSETTIKGGWFKDSMGFLFLSQFVLLSVLRAGLFIFVR